MKEEKRFRTKTGFCHILPDKIVLTRDGIVEDMSNVVVGDTIKRILIIYFIFSMGFFYFAYNYYKNERIFSAILFVLIGLYFILAILTSLNNSATPVIDRTKIIRIKYRKAIPGLTRSRFLVYFEDENGKQKKRLIFLPGSMTGGPEESKKALNMMKEEKLI